MSHLMQHVSVKAIYELCALLMKLIEASQQTGAHLERSARGKWSFKGLTGTAAHTLKQQPREVQTVRDETD